MDTLHLYLGIGADLLTFLGSAVLAKEAILRHRDLRWLINLKRGAQKMTEQVGPPVVGGRQLRNDQDSELHEPRKMARTALIGILLVSLGFLLQLILRIMDALPTQPLR